MKSSAYFEVSPGGKGNGILGLCSVKYNITFTCPMSCEILFKQCKETTDFTFEKALCYNLEDEFNWTYLVTDQLSLK